MRASTAANALGLLAALLATVLIARRPGGARPAAVATPALTSRRVPLPGGGWALADATGHLVPLRHFRRIVSTSTLADRLLLELCEADRILAFSAAGARTSPVAHRLAGKPSVEGLGAIEPIVALGPDLVLMNRFGAPGNVARLRAAGVEVFDLGELRGLRSLVLAAEIVGELVGAPERGARFARSFARRLAAVSAGLGDRPRRRAVYLAVIGTQLYGGTAGTSYHDVLVAAGLVDAAAERFRDWPSYGAEQLVALAPELVVTKAGMGEAVCAFPGLDRLPACARPDGVIELPAGLIDEPGPAMLDAAEILHERVYGAR